MTVMIIPLDYNYAHFWICSTTFIYSHACIVSHEYEINNSHMTIYIELESNKVMIILTAMKSLRVDLNQPCSKTKY